MHGGRILGNVALAILLYLRRKWVSLAHTHLHSYGTNWSCMYLQTKHKSSANFCRQTSYVDYRTHKTCLDWQKISTTIKSALSWLTKLRSSENKRVLHQKPCSVQKLTVLYILQGTVNFWALSTSTVIHTRYQAIITDFLLLFINRMVRLTTSVTSVKYFISSQLISSKGNLPCHWCYFSNCYDVITYFISMLVCRDT